MILNCVIYRSLKLIFQKLKTGKFDNFTKILINIESVCLPTNQLANIVGEGSWPANL